MTSYALAHPYLFTLLIIFAVLMLDNALGNMLRTFMWLCRWLDGDFSK